MSSAWAARDPRSAGKSGAWLLLFGICLGVLRTITSGVLPGLLGVLHLSVLALECAAMLLAFRRPTRVPWLAYPLLCVLTITIIAVIAPTRTELTIAALPLLIIIVVFASHWMGTAFARATTAAALLAQLYIYGFDHGAFQATTSLVFVLGATTLVHLVLTHSAEQHHAAVATIRRQAHHDALTGLANRQHVMDLLESALAQHRSSVSGAVGPGPGLLFIDLDGFKVVNDAHGHGAGDAVLQEVARRLEVVAAQVGKAARFGGDEFVLVLWCSTAAELEECGQRIVALISAGMVVPTPHGLTQVHIGASVGAAVAEDVNDAAALVAHADDAAYRAKRAGGHRLERHEPQRSEAVATHHSPVSQLHRHVPAG